MLSIYSVVIKSSLTNKKPYSVRNSVVDLIESYIDKITVCEIIT